MIRQEAAGSAGGAEGGHLAYSNTLGAIPNAGFGVGYRLADDIVTTVSDDCRLERYEFQVTGSPSGEDLGPFAVTFGLYDACPGRGGRLIDGTAGAAQLPDSGVYWVEFGVPPEVDVPIPNTVWLSLSFDRSGAGWVGGAPALVGYSDDSFEDSVFGCSISFGGFPRTRHASFNARLFVRDECPTQFVAYRARTPSLTSYVPGAGIRVAEDLGLDKETCRIVSYTVGVRGVATFELDLRVPDPTGTGPGTLIPGTEATVQTVRAGAQQIGRVFDPPIEIPSDVWITLQNSSATGRVSLVGQPANLGSTADTFAVLEDDEWVLRSVEADNQVTAMDVSISCAGDPIPGACCDLIFRDERGEAVCREVPRANCPFRRWLPDVGCAPDPFEPFCGQAACCLADGTCTHLSQTECLARGVEWFQGLFCDAPELECAETCVVSELPCSFPHDTPGCADPTCCAQVCDNVTGVFCCGYFWDDACASLAAVLCESPPSNDECVPGSVATGAHELVVPSSIEFHTNHATTGAEDPDFCCHEGRTPRCDGGGRDGSRCQSDVDCDGGVCVSPEGTGGFEGVGSVWFWFTVPPSAEPNPSPTAAIELSTCRSSAARDSLLQVFAVPEPDRGACADLGRCFDGSPCIVSAQDCGDGTRCVKSGEACSVSGQDCPRQAECVFDLEAGCHTLERVACDDDSPACSDDSTHVKLCMPALRRGDTYIVEAAGKGAGDLGSYFLEVREVAVCPADAGPGNGHCALAEPLHEGNTVFNLSSAGLDCPVDLCSLSMDRDVWFDYTAKSAGRVTVEVFGSEGMPGETPDLAVYEGCGCGDARGPLHACAADETRPAGGPSRVTFRVETGQCFKVRVGNLPGEPAEGMLRVTSAPGGDCPSGAIEWLEPPTGVVDARVPPQFDYADRYLGVDRIVVRGPPGADLLDCWSICEASQESDPNRIWSVIPSGQDQFTLFLARSLRAGLFTSISYSGGSSGPATGHFTVHPGNVNADLLVSGEDLLELAAVLTGTSKARWDQYSVDFDHDGRLLPVDLLEAVEVLRGSGARDPWAGTPLPQNDGNCP